MNTMVVNVMSGSIHCTLSSPVHATLTFSVCIDAWRLHHLPQMADILCDNLSRVTRAYDFCRDELPLALNNSDTATNNIDQITTDFNALWLPSPPEINLQMQDFISSRAGRHKRKVSHLGYLLCLLAVSKFSWSDISQQYLEENYSRNVMWYLKKNPGIRHIIRYIPLRSRTKNWVRPNQIQRSTAQEAAKVRPWALDSKLDYACACIACIIRLTLQCFWPLRSR